MLSPGRLAASIIRPNPVEITNEQQYQQALQLSEDMFVLLDIHEEWCGPNKAILPYYNQLWLDVDDAGKRIFLASICPLKTDLKSKLKILAPGVDFDNQGCRPLFIVVRNGHMVASIDGLNPPMIDFYLKLFLPENIAPNDENTKKAFNFN